MAEIYTRLGSLERQMDSHVSSCDERRKSEENSEKRLSAEINALKLVDKEVLREVAELKGKFALMVSAVVFIASALGSVLSDYLRGVI